MVHAPPKRTVVGHNTVKFSKAEGFNQWLGDVKLKFWFVTDGTCNS